MTKQTGTIITIVVAVLTLCCSMSCCAWGAIMATSEQIGLDDLYAGEWYYGIAVVCLGVLIWVVPLLCWLFLVRGKEDTVVEEYIEGSIEEDFTV